MLTDHEYKWLQSEFSKLLETAGMRSNRTEAYKDGILACKSKLKEFQERLKKRYGDSAEGGKS